MATKLENNSGISSKIPANDGTNACVFMCLCICHELWNLVHIQQRSLSTILKNIPAIAESVILNLPFKINNKKKPTRSSSMLRRSANITSPEQKTCCIKCSHYKVVAGWVQLSQRLRGMGTYPLHYSAVSHTFSSLLPWMGTSLSLTPMLCISNMVVCKVTSLRFFLTSPKHQ